MRKPRTYQRGNAMNRNLTAIAGTVLVAVMLPMSPASADITPEPDCADYVQRIGVITTSWQQQAAELEAWKARTAVLTISLATAHARADNLTVELAASESRADRLRAKIQRLKNRL